MEVWSFADNGAAQSVPVQERGAFSSDQAYVILTIPEDDQEQKLYLWAGSNAQKEILATAAKHAAELKETTGASYLRQQQGQEVPEFKQLFPTLEIKSAAELPVQAAASPVMDSSVPAPATAASPVPASNDKVATEAQEAEKEVEEDEGDAPVAEAEAGPAAPMPTSSAEEQEVQPEPEEHLASPASPAALPTDAPAFSSAVAPELVSVPAKEERAPLPLPAEAKAASPPPPAVETSLTPATASAEAAEKPAPQATPTAAQADAPKDAVEEPGMQSVSKAKEQLMSRLGGTLADPLAEKQQQKEGTNGAKGSTFLADSAKAWGGVSSGGGSAPPPMEVKIQVGEQSFGYEELKGMRAESGIDMTCKEAYLTDAEFEKVFGKDRAAFNAMPAWRRQMAKKQAGLF